MSDDYGSYDASRQSGRDRDAPHHQRGDWPDSPNWDAQRGPSGHGLRNRESFGAPDRDNWRQEDNPGYREQDYGFGQGDWRHHGGEGSPPGGYRAAARQGWERDAEREPWDSQGRRLARPGEQSGYLRGYPHDEEPGRRGETTRREHWGGQNYRSLYGERDRGRHAYGEQGADYTDATRSSGNRHYPGLAERYTGAAGGGQDSGRQWGAYGGAGWGMGSSDSGYWEGTLAGGHHHRGRGPKGYERSDERIKEDICERLTHDPVVDASDISVECRAGVVTLDGTIHERWLKHRVEDMVADCSGVKDVQNRLTVAGGPQSGEDSRVNPATARGNEMHRNAGDQSESAQPGNAQPGSIQ